MIGLDFKGTPPLGKRLPQHRLHFGQSEFAPVVLRRGQKGLARNHDRGHRIAHVQDARDGLLRQHDFFLGIHLPALMGRPCVGNRSFRVGGVAMRLHRFRTAGFEQGTQAGPTGQGRLRAGPVCRWSSNFTLAGPNGDAPRLTATARSTNSAG